MTFPAPFPPPLRDDFNRADGAIRGSNGWASSDPYGLALAGPSIVSNQMGNNGTAFVSAYLDDDFGNDCYASITIGSGWGAGSEMELSFLTAGTVGTATCCGYAGFFQQSGNWEIRRYDNGSDSAIASGFYAYVTGDQLGFRRVPNGGISVHISEDGGLSWTELGFVADRTYTGRWKVGFYSGGNSTDASDLFDDLRAAQTATTVRRARIT